MPDSEDFPVLFTVDGSSRHEVILVKSTWNLDQLKEAILAVSNSPNCAEILSKYRSKDTTDTVAEVKVKWLGHDGGKRLFPKETLLTDSNVEPVLRMMAAGKVRDVLDVTIVTKPVPGSSSG